MTAAERKRRSRKKLAEAGGREFLIKVEGYYLDQIEEYAEATGQSVSALLKKILQPGLDRFIGAVNRANQMYENGATDAEVDKFLKKHLIPQFDDIQTRD